MMGNADIIGADSVRPEAAARVVCPIADLQSCIPASGYWSCYSDAEMRESLRSNKLRMHNCCMEINSNTDSAGPFNNCKRPMSRPLIALFGAVCFVAGCSGETPAASHAMFASHARCAALYGILANATSSSDYKQHYSSQLENHTRIGVKIIPDTGRFKSLFEAEAAALSKELAVQQTPPKQAAYMQLEAEKCVDALIQYAKFIGAS